MQACPEASFERAFFLRLLPGAVTIMPNEQGDESLLFFQPGTDNRLFSL
jgi:hypothetical protein